jgi:hypothetical protein
MRSAAFSMDPGGAAVKIIALEPLRPTLTLTRAELLVARTEFAHAHQIVGQHFAISNP